MIEEFIRDPSALDEHRAAPLFDERCKFLRHLADQGYAHFTLAVFVPLLRTIAVDLDISDDGRGFSSEEVEAAAERWAACQAELGKTQHVHQTNLSFRRLAVRWLRFMGRLQVPTEGGQQHNAIITDYAQWMREERGLSPATIETRSRLAEWFLKWCAKRPLDLIDVRPTDVDGYLNELGARWSRRSMANLCKELRPFFRHAAARGWCVSGLDSAIETPRVYKHENLPRAVDWKDVERLVASTAGNEPIDVRDRAILLLLTAYALRRSEIVELRLEDFDWDRSLVSIRRPKPRRTNLYPLARSVSEAVIDYIQNMRPETSRPELFWVLRAPARPITPAVVSSMVSYRMKKLGIAGKVHGPHAIRHACAVKLMNDGFSLKEIADHLGHRDLDTTRIYAKVDLDGLRKVADLDLGQLK